MYSRNFLKVLLLTTIISLVDHAGASPVTRLPDPKDDLTKQSSDEVNDLNVSANISNSSQAAQSSKSSSEEESSFAHRDEDQMPTPSALLNDRFKYDVEILESRDMQKENEELEERFKGGAAIHMNTDNFDDEEIEINLIAKNDSDQPDHTILAIVLVVVALVSIGVYAAMVVWRAHLEQRYGMRELLFTEDDDFVRHQNNNNNNYNEISNSHDQH